MFQFSGFYWKLHLRGLLGGGYGKRVGFLSPSRKNSLAAVPSPFMPLDVMPRNPFQTTARHATAEAGAAGDGKTPDFLGTISTREACLESCKGDARLSLAAQSACRELS